MGCRFWLLISLFAIIWPLSLTATSRNFEAAVSAVPWRRVVHLARGGAHRRGSTQPGGCGLLRSARRLSGRSSISCTAGGLSLASRALLVCRAPRPKGALVRRSDAVHLVADRQSQRLRRTRRRPASAISRLEALALATTHSSDAWCGDGKYCAWDCYRTRRRSVLA